MNHFISLQEAIDMTSLYRSQGQNILKPEYEGQGILALSETFGRSVFDTVLSKAGCTGLRIYYGMSDDLKIHAIIVGVDSAGDDMLPEEDRLLESSETAEEDIIERGIRCPDICPPGSPLNE